MNSNELKKYAKEQGADLVGIASIDRFDELPPVSAKSDGQKCF